MQVPDVFGLDPHLVDVLEGLPFQRAHLRVADHHTVRDRPSHPSFVPVAIDACPHSLVSIVLVAGLAREWDGFRTRT
eukprot:scaffold717_cov402-Pavlova_lutheri.AAC.4